MGLVLRTSKSEGLLRSTGDPPNGVVIFVTRHNAETGMECSFAVDPSFQPDAAVIAAKKPHTTVRWTEENEPDPAVDVDVEEAVEGCRDEAAAQHLWNIYVIACHPMIDTMGQVADVRILRALYEFGDELVMALVKRFGSGEKIG